MNAAAPALAERLDKLEADNAALREENDRIRARVAQQARRGVHILPKRSR